MLFRMFNRQNLLGFLVDNLQSLLKGYAQPYSLSISCVILHIYQLCFLFIDESFLSDLSEEENAVSSQYLTRALSSVNAFSPTAAKNLITLIACLTINVTIILLCALYYSLYSLSQFRNRKNILLSILAQNYYYVLYIPILFYSIKHESTLGYINAFFSFVIALIVTRMGGKHQFEVTDHLAKRYNGLNSVSVCLIFMGVILRYQTTERFVHLLSMGVCGLSAAEIWMVMPFLDVRVERFSFELNFAGFFWNGFLFVCSTTSSRFKHGIAIALICMPVLLIKVGKNIYAYRRRKVESVFLGRNIANMKFDSSHIKPWMINQHIRAISIHRGSFQLREYMKSDMQTFYEDIILQHTSTCQLRPYCFCESVNSKESASVTDYLIGDQLRLQFHHNYVTQLYEKYMEQNKRFDEVYISYVLYLLEGMKNTCLAFSKCAQFLSKAASSSGSGTSAHNALHFNMNGQETKQSYSSSSVSATGLASHSISSQQSSTSGLQLEYLAVLSELQHRMTSRKKENQINAVIEFDEQLFLLHEQIAQCIRKKNAFLAEISKDYIGLREIERVGALVLAQRANAEKQFTRLWFEQHRLGASVRKGYQTIEEAEKDLFFSKKSVAIFASLSKDKFGRMQKVSKNIEPVLGYTKEEVLGQNISVFATSNLADFHNNLVTRFLKRGTLVADQISRMNPLIAKKKSGFLIPVSIRLQVGYLGKEEIGISGLVTSKKNLNENFIGIDMRSKGFSLRIDGFSEAIFHRLFHPACSFTRKEDYHSIQASRIFPLLPFFIAKNFQSNSALPNSTNNNNDQKRSGTNLGISMQKQESIEMIGFLPLNPRRLLIKSKHGKKPLPRNLEEYRAYLLVQLKKGRFNTQSNMLFAFSLTITYLREEILDHCQIQVNAFAEINSTEYSSRMLKAQLQFEFTGIGDIHLTDEQIEEQFATMQLNVNKRLSTGLSFNMFKTIGRSTNNPNHQLTFQSLSQTKNFNFNQSTSNSNPQASSSAAAAFLFQGHLDNNSFVPMSISRFAQKQIGQTSSSTDLEHMKNAGGGVAAATTTTTSTAGGINHNNNMNASGTGTGTVGKVNRQSTTMNYNQQDLIQQQQEMNNNNNISNIPTTGLKKGMLESAKSISSKTKMNQSSSQMSKSLSINLNAVSTPAAAVVPNPYPSVTPNPGVVTVAERNSILASSSNKISLSVNNIQEVENADDEEDDHLQLDQSSALVLKKQQQQQQPLANQKHQSNMNRSTIQNNDTSFFEANADYNNQNQIGITIPSALMNTNHSKLFGTTAIAAALVGEASFIENKNDNSNDEQLLESVKNPLSHQQFTSFPYRPQFTPSNNNNPSDLSLTAGKDFPILLSPTALLSPTLLFSPSAASILSPTFHQTEDKRALIHPQMNSIDQFRQTHLLQQNHPFAAEYNLNASHLSGEKLLHLTSSQSFQNNKFEKINNMYNNNNHIVSSYSQDLLGSGGAANQSSTGTKESNLSHEMQSLRDLSLSSTSNKSYDKTLKKIILHSIEKDSFSFAFLIFKLISVTSLAIVGAVIISTYIQLQSDFEKQIKDFYYIPWGMKMRVTTSRLLKDRSLYFLTAYPLLSGGMTSKQISDVKSEVTTNMESLSTFYLDNLRQIMLEPRNDLVLQNHLYESHVIMTIYLNSGAKTVIYPSFQYAMMMNSEALFLYGQTQSTANNTVIGSLLSQNFANFTSYFSTAQQLQETSVSDGFNTIENRMIALLAVISGVCSCFVLTTFIAFAYTQRRKERILKLFANLEPNKLLEMHGALVASFEVMFSGKTTNLLSVGSQNNIMKQKQDRLPYLNKKKKLTTPTDSLPHWKIELYIASLFVLGILLIYPIVNLITTINLISQSNSNQSLTGVLQTLKAQISSNLAAYATSVQSKLSKASTFEFNSARFTTVVQQNNAILSQFQGNVTYQEQVSRYSSDLFSEFFFQSMKSDACTAFDQYFNTYNTQTDKSFVKANCQSYLSGVFQTGILAMISKFAGIFADLQEINKFTDDTEWNLKAAAFFQRTNFFEINRIYEMLMLMIETFTTFIYVINQEFFNLMISIQTWLMIYQFVVLLLTYRLGLLYFINSIGTDLYETKRILSIFEAKYLQENSYILNYLKQ